MSYNPMYGSYQPFAKSPEQYRNDINQAINQLQQYSNQFNQFNQQYANPQTSSIPAISDRGNFVYVKSFEEVENAPTNLNGTATLFFDFEHYVFWSKKFVNGQHSIQTFRFMPLNGSVEEPKIENEEILKEEDFDGLFGEETNPLNERLNKIEEGLSMLLENYNKKKTRSSKPKQVEGDDNNEI